MSYKLIINAISQIGDNVSSSNEAIFADGISSVNSGVCAPLDMKTKSRGRKHVVSLMSCVDSFKAECTAMNDLLNKQNTPGLSIKVQYALKSAMEHLYESTEGETGNSDVAMLYTDTKNAYVAGYGNVNVYYFSSKTKVVQKVEYAGVCDAEEQVTNDDGSNMVVKAKNRISARVKRVSTLHSGDEYLLVGNNLCALLGDGRIMDIFTEHGKKAVEVMLNEAAQLGCRDNLTVAHVTVKKQRLLPVITLLSVAALVATAFLLYPTLFKDDKTEDVTSEAEPVKQTEAMQEVIKEEEVEPSSLSDSSSVEQEQDSAASLDGLDSELDAIASEITGENSCVSYYVKNLSTGEVLESNNSKMYSASLIKLYIMAEIYRQADAGELTIDSEIESLLSKMISFSDNDACNKLAEIAGGGDQKLGFEKITQNAVALGCEYTVQKNDLQAVREVPIEPGNFTSVKDCAMLLEKIYNGELVSSEASKSMLELLKAQDRRGKIPRDLPDDVIVANKTGETSTAQNDVAIVYAEDNPYIICIMISDYANSMDDTIDVVARMSKVVYDYITKQLN